MKFKTKNLKCYIIRNASFIFFSILAVTNGNTQGLGSLQFNGLDNYIEVEDSPLNTIGIGDFTIEAWIRGDESEQTAHPTILSNRGSNGFGGGIILFFHSTWGGSQSKMFSFQIDAVNHLFIDNGSFNGSILDNQCHHVAVSRNGNILSFFVDGIEIGSKTLPSSLTVNFDGPLWIGKDKATNNTFNGLISQCRIWNVARTEAEIFDTKDISLQGNESGLIAYWEMNDGIGQVVMDKTNQFVGVLGSETDVDGQDPEWSEEGCIDKRVVSVNDNIEHFFKVTPNPTSGLITIEYQGVENIEIRLVDQVGKLLLSKTLNSPSIHIDISDYPKGLYLLSTNYSNQIFTKKIIKL